MSGSASASTRLVAGPPPPNMFICPIRLSCCDCWPISNARSSTASNCARFPIDENAPHLISASIAAHRRQAEADHPLHFRRSLPLSLPLALLNNVQRCEILLRSIHVRRQHRNPLAPVRQRQPPALLNVLHHLLRRPHFIRQHRRH